MRIQHNILAMNAYRNYNTNTSALAKNLEKLSSGYKINRAGDDAAGLAISEKMRAQITGLNAASKNVKDGISLVKTAEGAMQEIQDMLNRMDYLATQSANGTYDDPVDRLNLQKEVDALKTEINRIADSANFNGINLLDGSMQDGKITGAKYESVDAADILGLIPPELNKGQPAVDSDKTIVEADAEKATPASFSVKLDNLNVLKDDNNFVLNIGGKDLTAVSVKEGMSSDQIAELFNGREVDLTDDNGNTVTFKITAQDNILNFKATESVAFNPPKDVTFTTSSSQKATDDIEVRLPGPKDAAGAGTPNKVIVEAYAEADGDTSASMAATGVTNLTLADDDAAGGGNGLDVDELIAKAKADGLTGDVTVRVDDAGKVGLYIGNDKIADGDADVTAGVPANGAGDIEVSFGDFGTVTFKNAHATDDVAADDIYGISVGTGLTINSGKSGETPITVNDAALKTALKNAGLDGLASGNVSVAYNKNANNGAGAWEMTADGQTIALTADATTTAGKLLLQDAGGNTLFTVDLSGAAIKPSEADFQDAFANGKTVAKLGKEATVTGTINGATQNIQLGTDGGDNRVANTTIDLSEYFQKDGTTITLGDTTYTIAVGKDSKFKSAENVIDLTDFEPNNVDAQVAATRLTTVAKNNNGIFSVGHDGKGNTTLQQLSEAKDSTDMTTREKIASYIKISTVDAKSLRDVKTASGLTLQIGDTSDSFNQMSVSIGDMHTDAMGTKGGKSIADINIGNQKGAQEAVQVIKDAINYVSGVRGDLGAVQNRLEHTANNLSVMAENIQDAESTIRDTDIAEEMMSYTKNNILVQSAQAMLAQANAVPQGVLQLLG
jgi:flagellin